ncbi:MAG: M48 family metallopeptidase [Candidatus Micrarchaeota archaeon]|nr:M48 family metallopeptidase [Candidatus Micrarchaeota archaeon]
MVSFYDRIEENKRNSVILLFFIFLILAMLIFAVSILFFETDSPLFFLLAALLSALYVYIVYKNSAKILLAVAGAKPVKKEDYPYLVNVVEGVSIAAGVPTPKIYVIEEEGINAFATGLTPQDSAVVFTTGLLKNLNRAEIEGVAAHEIAHIQNMDVRLATIAVAVVGLIALISDIILRSRLRLRSARGAGPLVFVALLIIILAPFFALMVRFALSRQREYLADATAAKLTRYPEGLASALEKIQKIGSSVKAASDTTAPLYFASPLSFKFFSTHPPIEERIKRLRQM